MNARTHRHGRLRVWLASILMALRMGAAGAEPTRLTLLHDDEFGKWLVGTEWEFPMEQGVRKAWFAAPGVIIWVRPDKSEDGYAFEIKKKGSIQWFSKMRDNERHQMTVDEGLTTAGILAGDATKPVKGKRLARRALPNPPKFTDAEFRAWLADKSVGLGDITVTFAEAGFIQWGNQRDPMEILRPGLIRFYWRQAPRDVHLLVFSEDLLTARAWCWWGRPEGKVSTGAPVKANAAPRTQAVVTMPDMKALPLAARQATVNSLTVMDLGNSKFAGKASKLSLSALNLEGDKPATVRFNQPVGTMMNKALQEVARYHAIRHGGWPRAAAMELTFTDKFTPKDGPSAAVACALLMESIFKGTTLDPAFAVTGDLNADGTVQPIGGVHGKLRGATGAGCRLLGIPSTNSTHAIDVALTDGLKPFLGIQVFALTTFDDALSVARADKSEKTSSVVKDFAVLAKLAETNPAILRAPESLAKLRSILERAPNHLSANILLSSATGKLPSTLSPAGSLSGLDQAVGTLDIAIGGDINASNKLDSGQISKARIGLQRLRSMLDPRVRPLADAWIGWSNTADKLVQNRSSLTAQNITEWTAAISRISLEDQKLRSNVSFREALE